MGDQAVATLGDANWSEESHMDEWFYSSCVCLKAAYLSAGIAITSTSWRSTERPQDFFSESVVSSSPDIFLWRFGFVFGWVCFVCLLEDTWLFAFTYSPICGNSWSKTKRFDNRQSLERARHELKKKQILPNNKGHCKGLLLLLSHWRPQCALPCGSGRIKRNFRGHWTKIVKEGSGEVLQTAPCRSRRNDTGRRWLWWNQKGSTYARTSVQVAKIGEYVGEQIYKVLACNWVFLIKCWLEKLSAR